MVLLCNSDLPDVGRNGEGEVFDMVIPMVPLPGESFWGDAIRNEYWLVLAIPHGHGDRGVVKEEAVPLPCVRGSCDPLVPVVDEMFVYGLDVDNAKVNVPGSLAVPMTVR